MIEALRTTGKPVCLSVATNLEESWKITPHYNVHLRRADLGKSDVEIIAKAMRAPELSLGPALRSLSMSYNTGLTDEGAIFLTQYLPATLKELGLVGCAIGDKGGVALLSWASKAKGLQIMCVERNSFSKKIRQEFALLAQEREKLQIFV